jgi:hypothetical protein
VQNSKIEVFGKKDLMNADKFAKKLNLWILSNAGK